MLQIMFDPVFKDTQKHIFILYTLCVPGVSKTKFT